MKSKARSLYGDDISVGRFSVLGILIKLISFPLALLWSALEKVYNSSFIDTATGQALFSLGQYIGISRLTGTRAVGEATFEGDKGTIIPPGFLIETDDPDPIRFETRNEDDEQIDESGELTLPIRAVEIGSDGNVGPGRITEIVNPISGLDNVTNEVGTAGGTDLETEREFRERYKDSTDKSGGSTTSSIRATILEETEASACIVLENFKDEEKDGLPPKSYKPIVLGGDDQEIAEAIFSVGAGGIQSFGEITRTVIDNTGLEKKRSFSRATRVDIYAEMTLTTNIEFSEDYFDVIEANIANYINGLSINDDVSYSRIISLAYQDTAGILDVELYIDTSPDPQLQESIEIAFDEVARIDEENIEVIENE
ncbi:baseplate J/gp47 family protein [Natroniella sp. ANB-PHB2]|uniref:baseplate J/gp47 family protein n=1 Tax=Natroniella sp. ANB-PHB2 TaxID=3384444 RepID=UPI0038D4BB68